MLIKYVLIFFSACIILTPVYLLIRRPWRFTGRTAHKREWLLGLFFVFMAGMFYMTFRGIYSIPSDMIESARQRLATGRDISLKPFHNLRLMYLYDDREHFIMNVLGNTLMFMPWGFMRPLLWKREQKPFFIIAGAFGITVFIEFVQLFISRTVDIDDIILNFIGGLAGAACYFALAKAAPGIKKLSK